MSPFDLTEAALREPWRLWTGPLAHWDLGHALVNLGACALPLLLLDGASRRGLGRALLWLLPLSSLLLLPFLQGRPYRGASGLACLLWTAGGLGRWRNGRPLEGLALALGALLKAALELLGGVHPMAPGAWEGLPAAHAVGAALGLAWGLQSRFRSAPCPPSSLPEKPSPTA